MKKLSSIACDMSSICFVLAWRLCCLRIMIIPVCYTVNMFTKESLFGGVHGYRVVL